MKLGLIVLVFGIAACDAGAVPQQAPPTAKAAPTTPPAEPPVHRLHRNRTHTSGTCRNTAFVGESRATGHITLAQVDAIDTLFVDNHYTSLNDSYEKMGITDAPSTNTSYRALDGHVKHIGHYHGDRDAPAILSTIEKRLDELVGIEQWIGTPAKRQRGAR